MNIKIKTGTAALALLACLTLVGCTQAPEPVETTPAPTQSSSPTVSPEAQEELEEQQNAAINYDLDANGKTVVDGVEYECPADPTTGAFPTTIKILPNGKYECSIASNDGLDDVLDGIEDQG